MTTFPETTITLLCKQFALEEGWNWEELETNTTLTHPKSSPPWSQNHIRQQIFQILNTFAPETKNENQNYYKSCTQAAGATIAINEELIKHYFDTGNLEGILSIFNFLNRCRERAETLSRHYLSQTDPRKDYRKETFALTRRRKSIELEDLNF